MANLPANLEYFVVDVFTETPLAGNPLAVVLNTRGLSTERMQAIAREFNLSETTFIERRLTEVERTEGVRVRIFTTQEELPFAGHPTLGTASVLKIIAPETLEGDTVRLALKVGSVPVRFESSAADAGAIYGEMTQRESGGPVCSDRFFGFLSGIIARRNRGGGNVKISFIDFQGLWEGRETALSFSALSTDRHFHGRLRCALCRPC